MLVPYLYSKVLLLVPSDITISFLNNIYKYTYLLTLSFDDCGQISYTPSEGKFFPHKGTGKKMRNQDLCSMQTTSSMISLIGRYHNIDCVMIKITDNIPQALLTGDTISKNHIQVERMLDISKILTTLSKENRLKVFPSVCELPKFPYRFIWNDEEYEADYLLTNEGKNMLEIFTSEYELL